MTTFAVGETPVDILAAATEDITGTATTLTANTTYIIQAEIPTAAGSGGLETFGPPYVHIADTTAAPSGGLLSRLGHKLRHQKSARASGANLWVWADAPAFISVHEEP